MVDAGSLVGIITEADLLSKETVSDILPPIPQVPWFGFGLVLWVELLERDERRRAARTGAS